MVEMNFNAGSEAPKDVFEPIPVGWYPAVVVKSDLVPTKNKDGHYINMQIKIIGEKYSGRVVFAKFNVDNKNQQAVQIAENQLARLSHAVGVTKWSDTEELHDKPFAVRIGVQAATAQYEASNKVTNFKVLDDSTLKDDSQYEKAAEKWGDSSSAWNQDNSADAGEDPPLDSDVPDWAKEDENSY